jgi:hypothetical protein
LISTSFTGRVAFIQGFKIQKQKSNCWILPLSDLQKREFIVPVVSLIFMAFRRAKEGSKTNLDTACEIK